MNTVGERVRHARLSKALTQGELSESSGIPVVTISRIENDRYGTPRPRTLRRLSDALDVSPAWLLFGEQDSRDTQIAA